MLIDTHCHVDAYPQPAEALAAAEAAGVHTIAVTTSLVSYVRTRVLCRQHPHTEVALGLHPRRIGKGYDQWAEWREMLTPVPLIGEVGLDFRSGKEENWTAQAQALAEIAEAAGGAKALSLHSHLAEAEAWDIVSGRQVRWVIWHDLRPEAPRVLLYRAVEAGHLLAVGPDAVLSASFRSRLRAVPREQVVTETNGPWSTLGTGDRAHALRTVLQALAEAWRCTPEEAETQVERNWARVTADLSMEMVAPLEQAGRAV
jgi:TatD DNase family protein